MEFIKSIYAKAKAIHPTIILADAQDERALLATAKIEKLGFANIILLGDKNIILKMQKELHLTLQARIFDKNIDEKEHLGKVKNNCVLAAMLVDSGNADGYVAGNLSTTKEIIVSAKAILATKHFPSSYFIMLHNEDVLFFADCAYHITPTPEELANIGVATANCAKEMGITPNIAFLSFSTHGSADHEHASKVHTATMIAKKLAPKYYIDGEIQFDAAFDLEIAKRKSNKKESEKKDHKIANVFVFPDLNSGNIAYKIATHMGGCRAIGPILRGFSHPISDLSRGCTIEDIVDAVAVVASQVKKKK